MDESEKGKKSIKAYQLLVKSVQDVQGHCGFTSQRGTRRRNFAPFTVVGIVTAGGNKSFSAEGPVVLNHHSVLVSML